MSILFGHPGGNPNSHHAALAHFEAGCLEAFCVPWMPSTATLKILSAIPTLQTKSNRLTRRYFEPLEHAPKIQGRFGEMRRLFIRSCGNGNERLSYEANDWLMRTMKKECLRKSVTAVHSYEDCSLWQFEEAKRLCKACIYDMPIGYYSAWEQTQMELAKRFADWLPPGGLTSNRWVRPEQKRREMELADLVLAPSTFARNTILRFHPEKKVALASYGVDLEFWRPKAKTAGPERLNTRVRFIYAGQCSIRKGTPLLLEAWHKARLREATLTLIGSWQLAETSRTGLPTGVVHHPPCSAMDLRTHYQSADVFVFPSFFEGFGLVILEAMACGLPVVTTEATAGPDILNETCGQILPTSNADALVNTLYWFAANCEKIPAMKIAARAKAETCTWANYRRDVSDAVASLA
jgi:glycosyltransferase involved in cell wall biosynthesis